MAGSRKLLSPEEIHQHAAQAQHWKVVDGKKLVRTYTLPDFQSGLHLVNRVGAIAEEQGHHPDIHLFWGKVEIETSTHDAGGLTEQDFLLASKIDRLS
jgi:4a-hydroxytetrahydrobiopterin dehydratase